MLHYMIAISIMVMYQDIFQILSREITVLQMEGPLLLDYYYTC